MPATMTPAVLSSADFYTYAQLAAFHATYADYAAGQVAYFDPIIRPGTMTGA